MRAPKPRPKQVSELTLPDFAMHPIWSFADDDGDDVVPVPVTASPILPWPEGGEALFVSCEFLLGDNTKLLGYIGVRMTNHSVYLLSFPEHDGSFFLLPINSRLEGSVSKAELEEHIHKLSNDIFPITFTTAYMLDDKRSLSGRYDMQA